MRVLDRILNEARDIRFMSVLENPAARPEGGRYSIEDGFIDSIEDTAKPIRWRNMLLDELAGAGPQMLNTYGFAVGTALAGRPPHGSVRELLAHTALALGRNVKPCGFTSLTPSTRRREPAQCPVCGRRSKGARGHRPFLPCLRRRRGTATPLGVGRGLPSPPFRSWGGFTVPPCPTASPLPALFGTFPGTTPISDFPAACTSGLRPRAFPDRPQGHRPLGNRWDLPVLGHRVSAHARVFDSVGPDRRSRLSWRPAWPSRPDNPVGTPRGVISELNSWPARTPIDASPATLPPLAHDTGPWWLATPSMSGSRIPYSMPVYPGAFCQAPWSRSRAAESRPEAAAPS